MTDILVIEDNVDLAFGLRHNLEYEGYAVAVEHNGTRGLLRARNTQPDLIVLDLMLPGMDGFHLLRELRGLDLTMPVLILTARGEEADKVRGLKLGADDYVTKPFGVMELLARVEALLRRDRGAPARTTEPIRRFGQVSVDIGTRSVTRNNTPVNLTPKEFDLLVALLDREGRIAGREELMRQVWGYRSSVVSRTVDTHIAELRRKLESDPANPEFILTIRKAGYRLRMEGTGTVRSSAGP